MENEHIKNNLIELIKKFDNKCSDCGKIFLGAAIVGSTEAGNYPVDVGLVNYPLSCGKCPDCAQKCYDRIQKYIKIHGKTPCGDTTIYEFHQKEVETIVFTDEEIREFIDNHIRFDTDCWMYFDENYQLDQLSYGNPNVEGGELIYLLEFLKEELEYNINKKNKV